MRIAHSAIGLKCCDARAAAAAAAALVLVIGLAASPKCAAATVCSRLAIVAQARTHAQKPSPELLMRNCCSAKLDVARPAARLLSPLRNYCNIIIMRLRFQLNSLPKPDGQEGGENSHSCDDRGFRNHHYITTDLRPSASVKKETICTHMHRWPCVNNV